MAYVNVELSGAEELLRAQNATDRCGSENSLTAYLAYNAVGQNQILAAYWEVQSIGTEIRFGCAVGTAMLRWNLIAHLEVQCGQTDPVNVVKQSLILAAHLTCNAAKGARPENAEFRSGCALGSAMLRWNLTNVVRQIWPRLSNRVWLRTKCAKCTKCTQRVRNPRTHGSETRERRQLCTRVRSAMLDTGANASLFGKCQSKFWQWRVLLCQSKFWQ